MGAMYLPQVYHDLSLPTLSGGLDIYEQASVPPAVKTL